MLRISAHDYAMIGEAFPYLGGKFLVEARRYAGRPLSLFIAASLCLLFPVAHYSVLPFIDSPNHFARHFIVANSLLPAISAYWEVEFTLVPNSAVDLILLVFPKPLDPYLAGRLVLGFSLVNFLAALMVLHRVIWREWSAWPLLGATIAYNGLVFWGFENFFFTLPFALHAISLWLASERWNAAVRLLAMGLAAALLYIGHVFVFACFAAAVGGRELYRLCAEWRSALRQVLMSCFVAAAAFLPPVLHFLFSVFSSEPAHGSGTTFGSALLRLQSLLWLTSGGINAPGEGGLGIAVIALGLFAGAAWLVIRQKIRISPVIIGPIAALVILSLLAPVQFIGVWFVHARIPIMTLALIIPAIRWRDFNRQHQSVIAVFAALLLIGEGIKIGREASVHEAEFAELIEVTKSLPVGARVLPVNGSEVDVPRRWHMPSHLIITRQAFVPSLFQGVHMVRLRDEWLANAHPQAKPLKLSVLRDPETAANMNEWRNQIGAIYWSGWREKFTHILIITQPPAALESLLPVRLVAQGDIYGLYEICAETCER